MGHCLLVYDIVHDRTRTKIAEICLDYGLDRFQYSAFMGILVRTHQEELMSKIKRQLGEHEGNIQLFTICEKDWRQRQVIEVKKVKRVEGRAAAPRQKSRLKPVEEVEEECPSSLPFP